MVEIKKTMSNIWFSPESMFLIVDENGDGSADIILRKPQMPEEYSFEELGSLEVEIKGKNSEEMARRLLGEGWRERFGHIRIGQDILELQKQALMVSPKPTPEKDPVIAFIENGVTGFGTALMIGGGIYLTGPIGAVLAGLGSVTFLDDSIAKAEMLFVGELSVAEGLGWLGSMIGAVGGGLVLTTAVFEPGSPAYRTGRPNLVQTNVKPKPRLHSVSTGGGRTAAPIRAKTASVFELRPKVFEPAYNGAAALQMATEVSNVPQLRVVTTPEGNLGIRLAVEMENAPPQIVIFGDPITRKKEVDDAIIFYEAQRLLATLGLPAHLIHTMFANLRSAFLSAGFTITTVTSKGSASKDDSTVMSTENGGKGRGAEPPLRKDEEEIVLALNRRLNVIDNDSSDIFYKLVIALAGSHLTRSTRLLNNLWMEYGEPLTKLAAKYDIPFSLDMDPDSKRSKHLEGVDRRYLWQRKYGSVERVMARFENFAKRYGAVIYRSIQKAEEAGQQSPKIYRSYYTWSCNMAHFYKWRGDMAAELEARKNAADIAVKLADHYLSAHSFDEYAKFADIAGAEYQVLADEYLLAGEEVKAAGSLLKAGQVRARLIEENARVNANYFIRGSFPLTLNYLDLVLNNYASAIDILLRYDNRPEAVLAAMDLARRAGKISAHMGKVFALYEGDAMESQWRVLRVATLVRGVVGRLEDFAEFFADAGHYLNGIDILLLAKRRLRESVEMNRRAGNYLDAANDDFLMALISRKEADYRMSMDDDDGAARAEEKVPLFLDSARELFVKAGVWDDIEHAIAVSCIKDGGELKELHEVEIFYSNYHTILTAVKVAAQLAEQAGKKGLAGELKALDLQVNRLKIFLTFPGSSRDPERSMKRVRLGDRSVTVMRSKRVESVATISTRPLDEFLEEIGLSYEIYGRLYTAYGR